ncbi:MAG: Ig-like domain-containing protein [Nitrosomonadales bacterium]|nr:Ig-like domain-containing protein [Nitrosomonadales bacterium]
MLLMLATLAGCGSGGTSTTTTTGPTTAATVQLLVNNPQLSSSGTTPVDVTAVVLDSAGQIVTGTTVVFSKGPDTTAYFSNLSAAGVSDASGIVTAKLNLGTNKANRTIAITATANGHTASNSVDVVGTTVTISGSSSLANGASTVLTITVKDSAGTAIPGVTVTVASQNGNTILLSPTSGITNSSGQITATVTADHAGATDVITATAAGTSKTQTLTINSASFAFTAPTPVTPAATIQIPLNTATPISVYWANSGTPVANSSHVTFNASRGTITGGNPASTTAGTATASISSSSAGPAIITASGPSGTPAATLNILFVATTASSITPQATPGVVQVTTGSASQSSNSSVISVIVRDAANNLVKDALVNFSISADPSGGTLNAANATTDASGSASVTYIAGTTSSPQNGVIIDTTVASVNGVVPGSPVTNSVTLTVSNQALLVRLGTDNQIISNPPSNSKKYIATVTDSAGHPLAGVTVSFALRPSSFQKGKYVISGTTWVKSDTFGATCPNEDLNFNGFIDPLALPPALPASQTEDTNLNGHLEPGGDATVTASGVTDANGEAIATVTYAKDHATWAAFVLEARTGVVGNDPPATVTFVLPGLASDYSNVSVAPPGQFSPYGLGDPGSTPVGLDDCTNSY